MQKCVRYIKYLGSKFEEIQIFNLIAIFTLKKCVVNTELHELVKLFFGNVEPSSPQMKLCTVPESTKLIFDASGRGRHLARDPNSYQVTMLVSCFQFLLRVDH